MEKYLGVKIIEAEPMTADEAWRLLQRPMDTSNADKEGNGYLVKYSDGYTSWSPKDAFEKAYRRIDNLTFGLAIEAMKKGYRVARKGWNGKGMWVSLVKADNYVIQMPPYNGEDTVEGECKGLLPWIGMKAADDKFVPWLASQADMLAEDWQLIE